jgi:hypothetical protein
MLFGSGIGRGHACSKMTMMVYQHATMPTRMVDNPITAFVAPRSLNTGLLVLDPYVQP